MSVFSPRLRVFSFLCDASGSCRAIMHGPGQEGRGPRTCLGVMSIASVGYAAKRSAGRDPSAQQTERRPGDFELLADRRVRLRRRRTDRAARLARPAARRRLRLSRRHRAAAVRHQESRIDPAVFPAGGAPAARARREMSRRRVQHRVGHRTRCAHARIRPGAGHRRARAGRCGRVPGDACRSHRGARDGEHGARGRLPGGDHCAGGPTPSSLRAPVPCSSRWRRRAGRTARSSKA